MKHIETKLFVGAKIASLDLDLRALGLQPIAREEAECYKATELAKAPKATRFYRVAKHIKLLHDFAPGLIMALLVVFAGAAIFAITGLVLGLTEISKSAGLIAAGSAASATASIVFFDKFIGARFYDQARWIERRPDQCGHSIRPELQSLFARVRLAGDITIICDDLVQNEITLDPVWWAVRGDDRVCFAITDQFGNIVRSA
jgi:hypothetical protein